MTNAGGDGAHSVKIADPTYWDIDDIQFHCRLSRSAAWRLVRSDAFPPPVVVGRQRVWPRAEVINFMEDRRVADHYGSAEVPDKPRMTTFVSRQVRHRAS